MAVQTTGTTANIKPGETYRFRFSVTRGKEKAVYPLTNFTASMTIKDALRDGATVFSVSSGSGLTVDEASGVVDGVFTASQTGNFVSGNEYFTSIRLVSASDTIISGIIKFVAEDVI